MPLEDAELELLKTIKEDGRYTRDKVDVLTTSVNTLGGRVGKVEVVADKAASDLSEHKRNHAASAEAEKAEEKKSWSWKGKIIVALITALGAVAVAIIAAAMGG
jgi:hypothetical protein